MKTASKIGLGITAGLTAAYFGSDYIAEKLAGSEPPEPPALPTPKQPEREPAKRAAVELTVGIDHTRSKIRAQIPEMVAAIVDFVERGGVLKDGDGVTICEVDEEAACDRFVLPDQKEALLQRARGIKEVNRQGVNTYLARGLRGMLASARGRANSVVALWTDGIEEDPNPDYPEATSPTKILVPRSEYLPHANAVRDGMRAKGGERVNTAVASNGDEFGALLAEFTRLLDAQAQATADKAAEEKFQNDLKEWQTKADNLATNHAAEIAQWKLDKDAKKATAENIRFYARITILLALLVTFGGTIGLVRMANSRERKLLKGHLEVQCPGSAYGSSKIPLSKTRTSQTLKVSGQVLNFQGTDAGVTLNGKLLEDGDQVAPNTFYRLK